MFALHELDDTKQKRCWFVEKAEELPSFLQSEHIKELFMRRKVPIGKMEILLIC